MSYSSKKSRREKKADVSDCSENSRCEMKQMSQAAVKTADERKKSRYVRLQ